MGRRQHYRRSWELWLWKVDNFPSYRETAQSAMGCYSVDGIYLCCLSVDKADWFQDSFYKSLTPDQHKLAFANEYDFDSPDVCILDRE